MTNVSKAMEYATTFEREAMREKLDADIEQRDYALKTVTAFKEENTHLRAMNFRLVEALASQAPLATTHYEGCYDSGQKHYECALLEVKRLMGESHMTLAWYDPTNHHVSTDKHDPLFTPLGQLWPLHKIPSPLTLEELRALDLERDCCMEDIRKIERHHGIGEKE